MSKNKILVAISGGIDSAVSALILKQKGYEIIGCFLKMHEFSESSLLDAKKVCDFLEIDLKIIDITTDFSNIIEQNFYDEYLAGRTPNPCVLCNKVMKWKGLVDVANDLKIEKIATGHYAQIKFNEKTQRFSILKAANLPKDQSYMLWRLPQEYLSRTIFPLGEFENKEIIRNLAKKNEIPIFAKTDSQDICFIDDNDYRKFITEFSQNINEKNDWKGDIILAGKKIGEHNGYPFFTVGQRRGLGIAYKTPLYVKKIDAKNKIVEVAELENTFSAGLIGSEINFIGALDFENNLENLKKEQEFFVKIRYKDSGRFAKCKIEENEFGEKKLIVTFNEPVSSVAIGQSVVLYSGNELVGGAIISEIF
jgi:tRNA-specific 2-thiouridylase